MKKYLKLALVLTLTLALFGTVIAKPSYEFVTIGTGGVTGVYYPTGGAISRMVNAKKDYNIKATVESTGGSVYNINAVLGGDLDFGIAQSDRQYQAWVGEAEWEPKGKQKDLRAVFAIHPESVTLVASADSDIEKIEDLRGKRVNLGNFGSGHLQNATDVLGAVGIGLGDLKAENVKAVESPGLIQDERIDAFFYTVGHPNGSIKESTSGRIDVRIVPIVGAGIDKLIKQKPYYATSVIPAEFYPNAVNEEDIATLGVKATLITSDDVDDKIVYAITKEVFENLDDFKKLHPAYKVLTKENMLQGLSAPIHDGAMKYYKEAGLDKYLK